MAATFRARCRLQLLVTVTDCFLCEQGAACDEQTLNSASAPSWIQEWLELPSPLQRDVVQHGEPAMTAMSTSDVVP